MPVLTDVSIGGIKIILICIIVTGQRAAASEVKLNDIYGNLIEANLNNSVDPCDDFYAYACGNWFRTYNESSEYIDMPGYMDYKVNHQLRDLMAGEQDGTAGVQWSSGVFKKAKDVYDSCEHLDQLVLNSFLTFVHRELHMQWPIFVIDQGHWANASNFDWLQVIAVLRTYGLNSIFLTHNVNVNPRNSSEYFLEIAQHYTSTPLDADDVENIFINFGLYHNESHALTQELLDFENTLNGISKYEYLNETDQRNYADNFKLYSIKELHAEVPDINWTKYFQIILNTTENLDNQKVQLFAWNAEVFVRLKEHLAGSSNETIAYYIMLKFMYHINANLPHSKPRNCIKYMRSFMPVFMNYLYEDRVFRSKRYEIEKALRTMFQNLKKSFESLVEENHLKLNKKEQHFILKELHSMKLKVGNLPHNCSETYVNDFYEGLRVNKSDFVQTHMNILRFTNSLHYKNLNQINASIEEKVYHLDPTALSSSSPVKIFDNAILVPHGYLQLPLFHPRLSDLHKYSLLGFILAHEIIHAYDLFHIVYDHNSNYDYLGHQVGRHYTPHLHCYAHRPSEIISENIADVSGMRVAYRFYQSLTEDIEFPFLKLTKDQYFFVNSVQFLCGDLEKITNLGVKTTDLGHDMHDTRVQQNWSKFEEFSLAFNCAAKSNTQSAAQETCRLW